MKKESVIKANALLVQIAEQRAVVKGIGMLLDNDCEGRGPVVWIHAPQTPLPVPRRILDDLLAYHSEILFKLEAELERL